MKNELKQKWKLLSFAVFLCIVALLVLLFTPNQNDENEVTETKEVSLASQKVFIKDFHLYQDDHEHDTGIHSHGSTENILYTYVARDKSGLYTGVIRENSFKETSETTAELLVDIEPSNTTYLIKLLNPDKKGYKPFSIACAPKNLQLEPGRECIDGGLPL